MPDALADRRSSPRYNLIVAATLAESGSVTRISARTSDISRTGCYVDTLTPLAKGKTLRVILTRGDETFETEGKVTYVSAGLGMGIQFDQPVDAQQLAVLDSWLEKATPLR